MGKALGVLNNALDLNRGARADGGDRSEFNAARSVLQLLHSGQTEQRLGRLTQFIRLSEPCPMA